MKLHLLPQPAGDMTLPKLFLLIVLVNSSFTAYSGGWQVVTESSQFIESNVNAIIFECSGNLMLKPSDENGIFYSTPPAEGDTIEFNVSGNTVKIRIRSDEEKKNNIYKNNNNLTVLVEMKMLENIVFSGSGKLEIKNFIGKTLHFVWNGSGDCLGTMDYENITILHNGSGKMELAGKTNDLMLTHSGTGDIFAKKLRALNGIVTLSGTGDIFVSVTGQLMANLNGTGNIYYYKNPKLKKSIEGWGTIAKRMEAIF